MLGLPAYLYRLVPANPILLRVVQTAGKRKRDLLTRCIYLGLLILLVMFSLLTNAGSTGGGASLAALAKVSAQIFQQLSYMQLFLVAIVAPIFTAGAITQERDSQTYDILLATPLTNGQIVLGTLLSRLFFVLALLISGIPVFSITQIFGGVAIGSIVSSVLIAASTAVVCGALAVGIAQAGLDAALDYARTRRQFGRAIAENQGLQWMLADMQKDITAARALVQRAAMQMDAGLPATMDCSIAKCFAGDVAVQHTEHQAPVVMPIYMGPPPAVVIRPPPQPTPMYAPMAPMMAAALPPPGVAFWLARSSRNFSMALCLIIGFRPSPWRGRRYSRRRARGPSFRTACRRRRDAASI
jgi:hypothetical protein